MNSDGSLRYASVYASEIWQREAPKSLPMVPVQVCLVAERVKPAAAMTITTSHPGISEARKRARAARAVPSRIRGDNGWWQALLSDFDLVAIPHEFTESNTGYVIAPPELVEDAHRCGYPRSAEGRFQDRSFGTLLGYPACCIDAYEQTRRPGVAFEERLIQHYPSVAAISEELILASQIFVPCSPTCRAALALGSLWLQTIRRAGVFTDETLQPRQSLLAWKFERAQGEHSDIICASKRSDFNLATRSDG